LGVGITQKKLPSAIQRQREKLSGEPSFYDCSFFIEEFFSEKSQNYYNQDMKTHRFKVSIKHGYFPMYDAVSFEVFHRKNIT